MSIPSSLPTLESISTSYPQTLTGTTPFQNENDGEIADKVSVGLRPEWPPNKPRKRLREQIKSCWNQEPNERPSAFRVLRDLVALSEVQPQEPLVSAEDHTMRTEQVYADDCSEESTFLDCS